MSYNFISAGTTYVSTASLGSGDIQWIATGAEVDGQIIDNGGEQDNYGSASGSVILAGGLLNNTSLGSNITIAGGLLENAGTLLNTGVQTGGTLVLVGEGPGQIGTAYASEVFFWRLGAG